MTANSNDINEQHKVEGQPNEEEQLKLGHAIAKIQVEDDATEKETADGPQCRICLAGSSIENLTASPCRCSGSMGHLHPSCLDQWLATRGQHLCEICLHPLRSPRNSIDRNSRPQMSLPIVPPDHHLLPPRMDSVGMSMDLAAMLVMAVAFMYLGYALTKSPDPMLIPRTVPQPIHFTPPAIPRHRNTPAAEAATGKLADNSRYHSSALEVTLFCVLALFLILVSTCGNVAMQMVRISPRQHPNEINAHQRGFTLSSQSAQMV